MMSTAKKLVSVNTGLILGFVAALFLVPSETPVWWLGLAFALIGGVINLALLRHQNDRTMVDRGAARSRTTWIISAALLFLLFDLALTRACLHS
jgi:hypothetical protein